MCAEFERWAEVPKGAICARSLSAGRRQKMNKIDRTAEEAADLTASLIAAPFKFTARVLENLFWWV